MERRSGNTISSSSIGRKKEAGSLNKFREGRLRWHEHIMRLNGGLIRRRFRTTSFGTSKKGRPKRRLQDNINADKTTTEWMSSSQETGVTVVIAELGPAIPSSLYKKKRKKNVDMFSYTTFMLLSLFVTEKLREVADGSLRERERERERERRNRGRGENESKLSNFR